MPKLSITDLLVKGKKVLVRVDFNVPLDAEGNITDDTRIIAALPTIRSVIERGGIPILMSHLGRPKGTASPQYSLAPIAKRLSELLDTQVIMAPDCVGPAVEQLVNESKPGQVVLLENLRFHRAEQYPDEDPSFAKNLSALGDCYVNDAFGTAHRPHMSVVKLPEAFPGNAAAGFLMQKEISFFEESLLNPEHPFYALIGGAKISTKIGVIRSLKEKVDALFIGGGMAYTFFKAQGIPIGNSIHDDAFLEEARNIIEDYASEGIPIYFPTDHVITDRIDNTAKIKIMDVSEGIPEGFIGVDIGPKTSEKYSRELLKAKTVFWNGPMGVFECPPFAKGTEFLARAIGKLSAVTVVGGGDSVAALRAVGEAENISHLSTGGGASLEFIEKGSLVGIDALTEVK